MAHDIFISYSTKDKAVAESVCAKLEASGLRCWIAPRDILPGENWGATIVDAIAASRAMVLVFSSNANTSVQIIREVERAVARRLPVVTLRIENVPPSKELEYHISSLHWFDAFNAPMDERLDELTKTVCQLRAKREFVCKSCGSSLRTPAPNQPIVVCEACQTPNEVTASQMAPASNQGTPPSPSAPQTNRPVSQAASASSPPVPARAAVKPAAAVKAAAQTSPPPEKTEVSIPPPPPRRLPAGTTGVRRPVDLEKTVVTPPGGRTADAGSTGAAPTGFTSRATPPSTAIVRGVDGPEMNLPADPEKTVVDGPTAARRSRLAPSAQGGSRLDHLCGTTLEGKYKVEKFICQGGMGSVWLARDNINRQVAIKVLLGDLREDEAQREYFLKRFRHEAEMLAKVTGHRNLVSIYSLGEYVGKAGEGFPFLVMDYIVGPDGKPASVNDRIQAHTLGFQEAIQLFVQTCDALEFVHQRGVWHRDIKPANILIDSEGQARLTDFGIARRQDGNSGGMTMNTDKLGSPHYMSPEQRNDPTAVDARADIYSMGVTLAQMLTGQLPTGPGWTLQGDVPKEFSKPLDEVIKKAMAARPADRYASARELGEAVRKAVHKRKSSVPKLMAAVVVLVCVGVGVFLALPHNSTKSDAAVAPKDNGSGPVPPAPSATVAPLPQAPARPTLKDLAAAISAKDVNKFDTILAAAPELAKAKDSDGRTMLHLATIANNPEILSDALKKSDADAVNAKDVHGRTALHYAAAAGHDELVTMLAGQRNATLGITDEDGNTPAQLARKNHHQDLADLMDRPILEALKKAVANKNYRGAPDSLDKLLEANPDLITLQLPESRLTGLQYVAQLGDGEATAVLLARGADANAATIDGRTALVMALQAPEPTGPNPDAQERDRAQVVRLLLPKLFEAPNKTLSAPNHTTLLHLAANRERTDLIRVFIENKASLDLNIRDSKDRTPLLFAAENQRWESARLLIEQPEVQADEPDSNGFSPLHRAAEAGNVLTVLQLLELKNARQPDQTRQTIAGKDTPLMLAIKQNKAASHAKVIRELAANADAAKLPDNRHKTPLHEAARNGDFDTVNLLVAVAKYGVADLSSLDDDKRTPLDEAVAAKGVTPASLSGLVNEYKNLDSADLLKAEKTAMAEHADPQIVKLVHDAEPAVAVTPPPIPDNHPPEPHSGDHAQPVPVPPVPAARPLEAGEPKWSGSYTATMADGTKVTLTYVSSKSPWGYQFADGTSCLISGRGYGGPKTLMTLTSPHVLFPFIQTAAGANGSFTYGGAWSVGRVGPDNTLTEFTFTPLKQPPITFKRNQ